MLKKTRLGFFTTSGIMAAILTALIITGFAFASGGMLFSPGALNAQTGIPQGGASSKDALAGTTLGGVVSHAEIAGQCNLCHAPFWETETMADRCVACHTDVASQWQQSSTLHGLLRKNNPNLACRNCHPDHRGPDSPLIDLTNAHFPHNSFGFSLTSHKPKTNDSPLGCNECHARLYTSFDQNTCISCHFQQDAAFLQTHVLDFGIDCLACHDGVETFGLNFNHNKQKFQLVGKHAEVQCAECHINTRTKADLKSTSQDCYSCHGNDDKHQHRLGSDCSSCHTTTGWTPASFDHNLSAYKLTGQHVSVACGNCHTHHVLQGTPSDCYSCHATKDAHEGRLGTACGSCHNTDGWSQATFDHNLSFFKLTGKHTNVLCDKCHINKVYHGTPLDCYSCHATKDSHKGSLGTSCSTCHNPSGWTPASFDHNLSAYKLTGQHINADCKSCHANNVFIGTPTVCYACHAARDAHAGQFGTNCETCHSTSSWKPATFNHNLSTFKLTGQHVYVSCQSCHVNNVFKGTPTNCSSCHGSQDPHGGQFGTTCGSCHSTNGWTPASFDHSISGFSLTGAHTSLACTQCHSGGIYSGLSTACVSCHAEPAIHAGQFGTDCAKCHNTSSWLGATFSHSGFALTGAHNSLACSQCHSSGVYSGLSTACISCHVEPAIHAGQFGTDCAQCHNTSTWSGATFNHPDGCEGNCATHKNATCADCHPVNYSTATCLKCHDSNTPH